MFVGNVKTIKSVDVKAPGAVNAVKKVLVGPEQGWADWVMRQFTLGAGGMTPKHRHNWPHINYILAGKGTLFLDGQEYDVEVGSVAYVPANAEHQFKNKGNDEFSMICIVPEEGDV